MRFINAFAVVITVLFLTSGCTDNNAGATGSTAKTTSESATTTVQKTDQDVIDRQDTIELDNGEKWKVNDEMKPFVTKGQKLVAAYLQNRGDNYELLAKAVHEQNDQLIESCTMKGKSHAELHKWLHPHLELVKSLEETKDSTKAKELVSELRKSYEEYDNYFQ